MPAMTPTATDASTPGERTVTAVRRTVREMMSKRQERKYCEAAEKMLATLKRGESRKWMNLANTVAALEKHYANCKRGCGRKIEGPWPPR